MKVVDVVGVTRVFPGPPKVTAVADASLAVRAGERLAVVGSSGAGKSTLMNILGLLDEPTTGTYTLLGHDVGSMRARERDRLRATALGFVFQAYHVLGHRTVAQNLELKLAIAGTPPRERAALTDAALADVGLTHRAHGLGRDLSGGEKQRLALARALVVRPRLVLADEPTGNLDHTNAQAILGLFDGLAADGIAVVVITHDDRVAQWADTVVEMVDGVLVGGPR